MQAVPAKKRNHLLLACASLCLLAAALTGCHNRAYSDLYVENMAAEIRDLEDQLYEYDYEYSQLEREVAALRAENARLQTQTDSGSAGTTDSRRPPAGGAANATSRASTPAETVPARPESILEPVELPDDLTTEDLQPPIARPGTASPPPRSEPDSFEPDFDTDQLLPPTIEAGEPMPPQEPLGAIDSGPPVIADNALELNLSRIEVPARLASQTRSDQETSDGDDASIHLSPSGGATIKPAIQQLEDDRVVELAFHPTLSRAANFDDEPDDDGLYLVLQPLNGAGQVVPIAADLSIVILDPSKESPERPGQPLRIGRHDYSANEIASKMRASGTSQGIHLRLPWNGPDPGADRVLVFARYTFPDGRQVIGDKEFFVTGEGGLRTVWAPRGTQSRVVTASHEQIASPESTANSPENRFTNVIRPASGTAVADSAPRPDE